MSKPSSPKRRSPTPPVPGDHEEFDVIMLPTLCGVKAPSFAAPTHHFPAGVAHEAVAACSIMQHHPVPPPFPLRDPAGAVPTMTPITECSVRPEPRTRPNVRPFSAGGRSS